ncbi:glycoside hydrolase family 15 protein [Bosea psychrotolerans]|uniref:glucan 1,4-alpha-glucosidase n=1 Tax=Bosea psychrotolerans TaxID=1871628 RepID=A0A2S4MCU9_9HYPH|nr:glycoside hydrolase family 15 protein [Bosea psychrotolerans]POR52562.1 glucoamylase [Bosea psychrotolerans]
MVHRFAAGPRPRRASTGVETSLDNWIEQEGRFAAAAMLRLVSATDLVCDRRAFGQFIVPKAGSVLAAPPAVQEGDPDYTFHWLRDSALIIDAVRVLVENDALGDEAMASFADFVAFSLAASRLSGPAFLAEIRDIRRRADPVFLQYVRSDDELARLTGDSLRGEVRVNPDGTLDITRWGRPQNDGPALRALTLLRWADIVRGPVRHDMGELLVGDLDYTAAHWLEPCYDIWEEEKGLHYYTHLVQRTALARGALWAEGAGDRLRASRYRAEVRGLDRALGAYWSQAKGFYLSRRDVTAGDPARELDIATILAVVHADLPVGAHSVLDPRVHATLARLEAFFTEALAINAGLEPGAVPAVGRYPGDVYFGGGAFYFATLGVAEFYYRLAVAVQAGRSVPLTTCNRPFFSRFLGKAIVAGCELPPNRAERETIVAALAGRGDAIMALVRHFTPPSGELSEQLDRDSGRQTSAKNLGWSYAAFITAAAVRASVCRADVA